VVQAGDKSVTIDTINPAAVSFSEILFSIALTAGHPEYVGVT
jgi:hypothetical protein